MNNQIIQTPASQIQSQSIVDIREKMIRQFQNVINPISNQNNLTEKENSKILVERIGYIFVIDITADPAQFKQVNSNCNFILSLFQSLKLFMRQRRI